MSTETFWTKPGIWYPHDYGYLEGTVSGDGDELDVWLGSQERHTVTGVVCTVDLDEKDVELKLLLGCTVEERTRILEFHNAGTQGAFLLERDTST